MVEVIFPDPELAAAQTGSTANAMSESVASASSNDFSCCYEL
jgi:hypothetical protein